MTPILHISDLRLQTNSPPINQHIQKQEILGLAGLEGHGQSAFLESLVGVYTPVTGTITTHAGHPIKNLFDGAKQRVIYMPSDRKKNGIFANLSVQDNFMFGNLHCFSKFGWLKKKQAQSILDTYKDELAMAYANPQIPISSLSGGNQQKVLLARAMAQDPEIMLLNDPTRGVDIQTRHTLYNYFRNAVREKGMTLVILSTELDEILELCDRVLVFRNYGIFQELNRQNMHMESLMSAMFGQNNSAEKRL